MINPTIAKKVINTLALCSALWLGSIGPVRATEVSDDFNRADTTEPHDIGANWDSTESGGPFRIVSNAARATSGTCTAGQPCVETWNANSFTNDQFAEVTIKTMTEESGGDITQGVVLRHSATSQVYSGYYCYAYTGATKIEKFVSGTPTNLANELATTWTTGDKLRCKVAGASPNITITLYKNDVQVLQATSETEFASGRVGILLSSTTAGELATNEIDAFRGGDGDGAPASPPATLILRRRAQ